MHNQVLLPWHLNYLLLSVDVSKSHFPVVHVGSQLLVSLELKVLGPSFSLNCLLGHLLCIFRFSVVVGTLDYFIIRGPFT